MTNKDEQRAIQIYRANLQEFPQLLGKYLLHPKILYALLDEYISKEREKFSIQIDYYAWLLEFLDQLKVHIKMWIVIRYFGPDFKTPWRRRYVCLLSPFYLPQSKLVFTHEDYLSLETTAIFHYLLSHSREMFNFGAADTCLNVSQWNFFYANEEVSTYLLEDGKLIISILYLITKDICTANISLEQKILEIESLICALQDFSKKPHTWTQKFLHIYLTWYREKKFDLDELKKTLSYVI